MTAALFEKSDAAAAQQCAKPFASQEQANAALAAFVEEVYQLRLKHNLANVCLIVRDEIEGHGPFMAKGRFGEPLFVESMAAWFFGQAQSERQQMIMSELADSPGIKNTRNRV